MIWAFGNQLALKNNCNILHPAITQPSLLACHKQTQWRSWQVIPVSCLYSDSFFPPKSLAIAPTISVNLRWSPAHPPLWTVATYAPSISQQPLAHPPPPCSSHLQPFCITHSHTANPTTLLLFLNSHSYTWKHPLLALCKGDVSVPHTPFPIQQHPPMLALDFNNHLNIWQQPLHFTHLHNHMFILPYLTVVTYCLVL